MVRLKRETGSLAPKRQSNPGIGKLTPHEEWVSGQVDAKGEITLKEMTACLLAERGVSVAPSSVWQLFQRFGLTHKKKTFTSAISSLTKNAATSSEQKAMEPIKCKVL